MGRRWIYKDQAITPLEGKSLLPVFKNENRTGHEALYWEHMGNKAVRQGDWKLVSKKDGDWELYNLKTDRTELNDQADEQTDVAEQLRTSWEEWAARVGVQGY